MENGGCYFIIHGYVIEASRLRKARESLDEQAIDYIKDGQP